MIRSTASPIARAVKVRTAGMRVCVRHTATTIEAQSIASPHPTRPHPPLHRTFASTATPRKRGEPVKLLPDWSWRRAWRSYPVPAVEVVSNADDADTVLDTLTSSRLSLDAEPGAIPQATATQRQLSPSGCAAVQHGVLSVADGEGVILLHLANMDRFPAALKRILEDENIEKQIIGAGWWLKEIAENPDYYGCAVRNLIDLRRLAQWCWPTLSDRSTRPETHNDFIALLARDMLGLRYVTSAADGRGYHFKHLQGNRLEVLINQAWFTHCAGSEIRAKVIERVNFKLSRMKIPIPESMAEVYKQRLLEEVNELAKCDFDVVQERVRRVREADGRG